MIYMGYNETLFERKPMFKYIHKKPKTPKPSVWSQLVESYIDDQKKK